MIPLSELITHFQRDDLEVVQRLISKQPELLQNKSLLPRAVRHGTLRMVKFLHEAGASNVQKALGSICYGKKRNIAEYLVDQGASMHVRDNYGLPILGTCEVLNPAAMQICLDFAKRAFTQDELKECVAMVLTTYSRNPAAKHQCLELLEQAGYVLSENVIMAFHKGDLKWLEKYLRENPADLHRRFSLAEIYPVELIADAADGLHLTPLDGATLLHLAGAYHEKDMVELFLSLGANPDAKALIDEDGFGGQTPIFHTVVSYPPHTSDICGILMDAGADLHIKVNLRKQLRHMGDPELEKMYVFKKVDLLEYAQQFQVPGWVNQSALNLLQ